VRENVPDIDDLPPVFDYRDEPILVSTDIKHGEVIHSVSVREVLSNVRQMPPGGAFRDHIPVQQRFESASVPRAEFRNRRLADDPHIRCYQYGNRISSGPCFVADARHITHSQPFSIGPAEGARV